MNDIFRRLSAVEASIDNLREQVAGLREQFAKLYGKLEQFATKAELAELRGKIEQFATKAELNALETRLIYWIVGTALTLGVAQYLTRLFGV